MRLPPLWAPLLILGLIPSCGIEYEPPPENVRLEIDCPMCEGFGIDTVLLHDEAGVRKIALSSGRANAQVKGASVVDQKVWFATSSGPMVVDILSRQGSGVEASEEIELIPIEWTDSALADTVVKIPLRDAHPKRLVWEGEACVGSDGGRWCGHYQYAWKAAATIVPDTVLGLARLSMPRLVAREGVHVSVYHQFGYRGYARSCTSLRPFPDLAWPPTLGSSGTRIGKGYSWRAFTAIGRYESFQLRQGASGWIYHRVVFDARSRLWEDSGSWDSATGSVRFARRGPGLRSFPDSTRFMPRLVSGEGMDSWWWDWDPALDSVAVLEYPAMSWVYFAEPR